MNESHIIRAVLQGDAEQYGQLVQRYHVGLIIHCERLTGNRAEAEDIAQEAFIKAYQQLRHFKPERGRFSTWLYTIATHLAFDALRKQKHQLQIEDIEQLAEATMPATLNEAERQEVRRAVESLVPPEYRLAVEAYYWHGKSYQQIAGELGAPIGTVRTWLHRAKLQLNEKLS